MNTRWKIEYRPGELSFWEVRLAGGYVEADSPMTALRASHEIKQLSETNEYRVTYAPMFDIPWIFGYQKQGLLDNWKVKYS